jgi:hypothetical protein
MMRLAMTLLWMLPAPGEAHQLWINVIESQEGGHYLAFVGHGHVLPMEETLVPDYGAVVLDHYDLIAPDGTRASLRVPDQSIPAKQQIGAGATVQDGGDIGLRKITLEEESPAGTWQLAAATPMSFFVRYKDRTGVERFASTPVAQIKDLGSVVTSTVYANFMKAQFITGDGEPAQPAPIGHALELVPQSDLRQVRVGDTVRFKVLLYGKALKDYGAYFTARSMSFGLNQLQHAPLRNGTGEIRIPAAGQWRVEVMKQGPTADFPGMEQYRGDWKSAEVAATFTFHVLP